MGSFKTIFAFIVVLAVLVIGGMIYLMKNQKAPTDAQGVPAAQTTAEQPPSTGQPPAPEQQPPAVGQPPAAEQPQVSNGGGGAAAQPPAATPPAAAPAPATQ